MSDGEFETADAGAAEGIPVSCGAIRKGSYVLMKGKPCKIVEVSTSKTGKHGASKTNFVGIDMFSGKKLEECRPSSYTVYQPVISRQEAQVTAVETDGFLELLLNDNTMRSDISAGDQLENILEKFNSLKDDEDLLVSIISAMGQDKCLDCRVVSN